MSAEDRYWKLWGLVFFLCTPAVAINVYGLLVIDLLHSLLVHRRPPRPLRVLRGFRDYIPAMVRSETEYFMYRDELDALAKAP